MGKPSSDIWFECFIAIIVAIVAIVAIVTMSPFVIQFCYIHSCYTFNIFIYSIIKISKYKIFSNYVLTDQSFKADDSLQALLSHGREPSGQALAQTNHRYETFDKFVL